MAERLQEKLLNLIQFNAILYSGDNALGSKRIQSEKARLEILAEISWMKFNLK